MSGEGIMGIGRGALLLAVVGGAALLMRQGGDTAPVTATHTSAVAAKNPQATYDAALAIERQWNDFKAGKVKEPPQPYAVTKADRDLGEIPLDWANAEDAVALVRRLRAAMPDVQKAYAAFVERRNAAADAAREKQLLADRKAYPKTAETNFLDAGQDVYLSVEGKDARTLKVKYILMSRPLVHQMSKNDSLIRTWRGLGFRKIILTDGYNAGWTLGLD